MNKYLDIFNKWKEKKEFGSWSPLKNHAITCIYGINVESIWHAHFHRMVFFLYALYFHWDLQCRLVHGRQPKTSQRICCIILRYMLKFQSFSKYTFRHFWKSYSKKQNFDQFLTWTCQKNFFNQLLAVA